MRRTVSRRRKRWREWTIDAHYAAALCGTKTRMMGLSYIRTLAGPVLMLLSVGATLSACGRSPPPAEVTMTRSVVLAVGREEPEILISDHTGGFVIAGAADGMKPHAGAWAVRVDASGRKLWEYRDSAIPPEGSAKFSGAAMLSDGGVLLCGHEYTGHSQEAVIVRISAEAKLVYKHFVHPLDDPHSNWNGFSTCTPWHNGIAVLGSVSTLTPSLGGSSISGWLIKFDANGQYQWRRRGELYLADEALEASNHDLILVDSHVNGSSRIVRVNEHGDVTASTTIKGVEAHFVYPLSPAPTLRLYALQWSGPDRYITLDRDLRIVADEQSRRLAPRKAYELPGGTILLFGGLRGLDSTAAVGFRYPRGRMEARAIGPLHQSVWIIDAIPTSRQNEFLTLRNVDSIYRQSFTAPWVRTPGCTPECVTLSWVTIKPHLLH